jgi:aspartokinase/homoserine dehydrogenase 1
LNVLLSLILKKVLLNKSGISINWKNEIKTNGVSYNDDDVIAYANEHHLENLIVVDNTAAPIFCRELYLLAT